jgi:hypothetical protein
MSTMSASLLISAMKINVHMAMSGVVLPQRFARAATVTADRLQREPSDTPFALRAMTGGTHPVLQQCGEIVDDARANALRVLRLDGIGLPRPAAHRVLNRPVRLATSHSATLSRQFIPVNLAIMPTVSSLISPARGLSRRSIMWVKTRQTLRPLMGMSRLNTKNNQEAPVINLSTIRLEELLFFTVELGAILRTSRSRH